MYYIYIIRCNDNSLYTGITKDINERIKEHYYKTKKGAKYTRARDIISLEALWITDNRSNASKLEYQIKHFTKQRKEEIILNPSYIDDPIYEYVSDMTLKTCLD